MKFVQVCWFNSSTFHCEILNEKWPVATKDKIECILKRDIQFSRKASEKLI